jgi:hypothetical protein
MPLTEEELMERRRADAPVQACGLPPETIARWQLWRGMGASAVASMLIRNGWSKDRVRSFMKAEGRQVSFQGDLTGPCFFIS